MIMKIINVMSLSLIVLGNTFTYAQEQPEPQSPCGDGKCGSKKSLADCNEDLEYEQNTNTVYIKGSGKPFTGICEGCHYNGNREHCASFLNGKEDGVSMTWYEDGQKMSLRSHVGGVEHGVWMYWFPPSGKGGEKKPGALAWEKNYSNGKINGTARWYFEDGTEKKVENYKEGILDGQTIKYSRPGIKDKEVMYKNGVMDGSYKSYFENQNPQIEMTYKSGKEHGPVKYYHENTQLALEGEYKGGMQIGKWKRYYPSGVDMITENFNNAGQLDGMVYEHWEDGGKLKREAFYQAGQLRIEQKYDEFGNPIDEFGNRMNPEDVKNVQAEGAKLGSSKGKKDKKNKEKKSKEEKKPKEEKKE